MPVTWPIMRLSYTLVCAIFSRVNARLVTLIYEEKGVVYGFEFHGAH